MRLTMILTAAALFGSSVLAAETGSARAWRAALQAQDLGVQTLVEPPLIYSKAQISGWVDEARRRAGSQMEFELLETKEWSDYVNFHHFVPLTYEGVPADYRFNYNWPGSLDKSARLKTVKLPSAEVTETGKFILWWNRCNFYQLTEEECKSFIHMAVTHEGRHFAQWQSIAQEVVARLNGGKSAPPPATLADISQIPGAKDTFMRKWSDGPHYQCREVEVYTAQILAGEMPEEAAKLRLGGLANYYKGCRNSQWKNDFQPHLDAAAAIFKKHNFSDY